MKKNVFFLLIVSMVLLFSLYYCMVYFKQKNNKAIEFFNSEDYISSSRLLKALIDKKKNDMLLNYNYAATKYKLFNYDDVIDIYNGMLNSKNIDDILKSELYYNLGNIYFLKNDNDMAIENYKTSLILNPDDFEAKYNIECIVNLNLMLNYPEEIMDQIEENIKEQDILAEQEKEKINSDIVNIKEKEEELKKKNEEQKKEIKEIEKQNQQNTQKDKQTLIKEKETVEKSRKQLEEKIKKQELETKIKRQEYNDSNSRNEIKTLEEEKKSLQQQLTQEFGKANAKMDLVEKIESDIVQEVVRPDKVVNPKKIIERYFRSDGLIHHKYEPHILLEEEKELIFRDIMLGANPKSKEEEQEEKHQIVYNDPGAVSDPNQKPGKYRYEHEDIIKKQEQSNYNVMDAQGNDDGNLQEQQENNRYVQNTLNSIDLQKQKIFKESSQNQMDILNRINQIDQQISLLNEQQRVQLQEQQSDINSTLDNIKQEKNELQSTLNRTSSQNERQSLQREISKITEKEKSLKQELNDINSDIEKIDRNQEQISMYNEYNMLQMKENILDKQIKATQNIENNSEYINDFRSKEQALINKQDDLLNEKNVNIGNLRTLTEQLNEYENKVNTSLQMQKNSLNHKSFLSEQYQKQLDTLKNINNNMEESVFTDKQLRLLEHELKNAEEKRYYAEKEKDNVDRLQD